MVYIPGQGWVETGNLNAQEIQNMIDANSGFGNDDNTPPPADMSPQYTTAPANPNNNTAMTNAVSQHLHWNHPDDDAFIQWPAWQTMGLSSGMGTGTGVSGIGAHGQYQWGGTGPTPAPFGVNQQGVPYAGSAGAGETNQPFSGGGGFGLSTMGGPGSGGFGATGTPGGRIWQKVVYGH